MNRAPAFQFYPNDFLSDPNTLVMPVEAIGAYCLLLFTCWKQDGLPVDVKKLSGIARMREKKFTVAWEQFISVCFYLDPQTKRFRHKRLDKELEKQRLNSDKNRHAAEIRWNKEPCKRNADAMQTQCSSSSSSSSSSTAVKKRTSYGGRTAASPDTSPVIDQDKARIDAVGDPVERRIWKDGISLMIKDGMTEASARTLLGRLAKEYTKPLVAQAIAATQAENPAECKTFLIGVLKERAGKNKRTDPGKIQHIDQQTEPCSHCGDEFCLKVHRDAA